MGCFVPRHFNSPRLAPSSLSSLLRSCRFALALLFGRGGESESDEGVFGGTPLCATEAGEADEEGLLVRDAGLLWAAVAVKGKVPLPFPGCLPDSSKILSSSSSPASVCRSPALAWPRICVPGPCRTAVAFAGGLSPELIFTCSYSMRLFIRCTGRGTHMCVGWLRMFQVDRCRSVGRALVRHPLASCGRIHGG